jgi:hypothetical protein
MADDRDALISENHRLLNSSRRWRAIAIAALVLVFLVMFPFTLGVKQVINYFSRRDDEKAAKKHQDAMRELEKAWEWERERLLREKGDQ